MILIFHLNEMLDFFLKNNDKNIMNCNKTIKYSENFIRQIGKLHNKRNLYQQ